MLNVLGQLNCFWVTYLWEIDNDSLMFTALQTCILQMIFNKWKFYKMKVERIYLILKI